MWNTGNGYDHISQFNQYKQGTVDNIIAKIRAQYPDYVKTKHQHQNNQNKTEFKN